MRARTVLEGSRDAIRTLNGASGRISKRWKQDAFSTGASAVKLARDNFRTEVRSAQRVRSYGHRVSDVPGGVALDIGPIRPGVGGKVPTHARVFEGFDAAGKQVSRFVIRPKKAEYLVFPIRRGGGLSKASIVGWVKTKGPIVLTPDPSFPRVREFVTPELTRLGGKVFQDELR